MGSVICSYSKPFWQLPPLRGLQERLKAYSSELLALTTERLAWVAPLANASDTTLASESCAKMGNDKQWQDWQYLALLAISGLRFLSSCPALSKLIHRLLPWPPAHWDWLWCHIAAHGVKNRWRPLFFWHCFQLFSISIRFLVIVLNERPTNLKRTWKKHSKRIYIISPYLQGSSSSSSSNST